MPRGLWGAGFGWGLGFDSMLAVCARDLAWGLGFMVYGKSWNVSIKYSPYENVPGMKPLYLST